MYKGYGKDSFLGQPFVPQKEQILLMLSVLDDLSLPFTNNQTLRGLCMVKVQQKIAAPFRIEEGETAF